MNMPELVPPSTTKLLNFLLRRTGTTTALALSRKLGCEYRVIWRITNGKQKIGPKFLGLVSNALGIPVEDLTKLKGP